MEASMQSACAWASIYCESDDGACFLAQRRMFKPPARRHAVVLPYSKRALLSLCVVVVTRVIDALQ
jgi:hypothetical protein